MQESVPQGLGVSRQGAAMPRLSLAVRRFLPPFAAIVLSGCASITTSEVSSETKAATVVAKPSADVPELERCAESLGTLGIVEDKSATWYHALRTLKLDSTVPVLRQMIQQSNCFVIVERGAAMQNMTAERSLQRSGELHGRSNMGQGQMAAADYTISPSVDFGKKAGGTGGLLGGISRSAGMIGGVVGSLKQNGASTTLTVIDNRSGVLLAVAEGNAEHMDINVIGGAFDWAGGGAANGYAKTPEGRVIIASFADSYNRLVKSVRSYKAQNVRGGQGTGGQLAAADGPNRVPPNPFVNLDAPRSARPAQQIAVQVWLSRRLETPGVRVTLPGGKGESDDGRLQPALPRNLQQWKIDIVLSAPGFDFDAKSSNQASLVLTAEETSDPARFNVVARAGESGVRQLRATLWYEGSYLGSVRRDIEIEAAPPLQESPGGGPGAAGGSTSRSLAGGAAPTISAETGQARPAERSHVAPATEVKRMALPGSAPLSADLTIFVRHEDPRTLGRADVVMSSPYLKGLATERLDFPPDAAAWLAAWFDRLQRLPAAKDDAGTRHNVAVLRGLGNELYERLAPKLLRRTLADLLRAKAGSTLSLQIYSNNPTIPWELMRPGVTSDSEVDFLGIAFRLARWHVDGSERAAEVPLQRMPMEEIVVMAPQYPDRERLSAQAEEVAFLSRMKGFRRAPGTFDALRRLAENPPAGIVHFAGHGEMAGPVPAQRRYFLRLEDSRLDAVAWRGLPRSRASGASLYFFNACDLGFAESQAGSVAGWAPALLDGGAGGFIGGLWSLQDGPASRFAIRFYGELGGAAQGLERRSVSEAMRRARALFFETGDPTHLAYVYYGDVNLELMVPN